MGEKRDRYDVESGKALREDDSIFDVTKWQEGQTQLRNGQTHIRVYDPSLYQMIGDVIELLTKIETHMSVITGEEEI